MKTRQLATPRKTRPLSARTKKRLPVTVAQLEALPFFSEFSPAHLERIRPAMELSYFEAGSLLLTPDRAEEPFFVILSGRVNVECTVDRRSFSAEEIGIGEGLGFPWLFTPDNLLFAARCLEPVTTISFGSSLLRTDLGLEPGLGYELTLHAGRAMMKRMEAIVRALTSVPEKEAAVNL